MKDEKPYPTGASTQYSPGGGKRVTEQWSDGTLTHHEIPVKPKIKAKYRGGADSGRGDDPHGYMKTYHNYLGNKDSY